MEREEGPLYRPKYKEQQHRTTIRSFVDDVRVSHRGKYGLDNMIKIAKQVGSDLSGSHLIISTKTLIVSTKLEHARRVQKELLKNGITAKMQKHAKDLGIQTTAGQRRTFSGLSKRIREGK